MIQASVWCMPKSLVKFSWSGVTSLKHRPNPRSWNQLYPRNVCCTSHSIYFPSLHLVTFEACSMWSGSIYQPRCWTLDWGHSKDVIDFRVGEQRSICYKNKYEKHSRVNTSRFPSLDILFRRRRHDLARDIGPSNPDENASAQFKEASNLRWTICIIVIIVSSLEQLWTTFKQHVNS